MKTIDIIASGYEWICPDCGAFNKETGVHEIVECSGCGKEFETNPPEHAFS